MSNSDSHDVVDLEETSKSGGTPPPGRRYRIRIDRDYYVTAESCPTARQILALAGKDPARFRLFQRFRGGEARELAAEEKVDLTQPGIERFVTLPLDQTDGHGPRREFALPDSDVAYLESLGASWETVRDGALGRLIVHGFPLPVGYAASQVSLNFRIEPGYPDTQIDTVYFSPPITRLDGRGIAQVSDDAFDGRVWQRWSRHRSGENPWRPGIDDVSTQLALTRFWLNRELSR